ncbi:MAG: LysR family transcriptional regulator [Gammaproteobacteria bacterium]|nr:LysR family transcriptional regulator [Gammaproteobacteria bacterium]
MNLRQLRTLSKIRDSGSFAAAGDQIGLSQAAISVQMHQLEKELEVNLFDRSSRPVALTAEGVRVAQLAREVLDKVDGIKLEASGAKVSGSVSIGFIPTSVHNLLPRVLDALRRQFPELQVSVKSGLSGELAAAVVRRELDYALLTAPLVEMPELEITVIASEPFYVIAPVGMEFASDAELLRSMPYIAFNKRTWVGRHIAAKLQQRGIHLSESIEIDSLEAIENLVADGFGVSIVPRRLHAALDNQKLNQVPFGNPIDTRQLVLVQHIGKPKSRFDLAIKNIFVDLPRG